MNSIAFSDVSGGNNCLLKSDPSTKNFRETVIVVMQSVLTAIPPTRDSIVYSAFDSNNNIERFTVPKVCIVQSVSGENFLCVNRLQLRCETHNFELRFGVTCIRCRPAGASRFFYASTKYRRKITRLGCYEVGERRFMPRGFRTPALPIFVTNHLPSCFASKNLFESCTSNNDEVFSFV